MTQAPTQADRVPAAPLYRFTVAQYRALAEAGILADGDPVELIEGFLVAKMTKNRPHALALHRLQGALTRLLPAGWHLETQEAIITADSVPEPDAAVIRGQAEDYPEEHPHASAVGLVVEISDSSLRFDRTDKKRLYARAGIPVYWIVNLIDRRIEVYADPTGPTDAPDFREAHFYLSGDPVPVSLDGALVGTIPVAEILPAP